jgi:hypothetical protein
MAATYTWDDVADLIVILEGPLNGYLVERMRVKKMPNSGEYRALALVRKPDGVLIRLQSVGEYATDEMYALLFGLPAN